MDEGNTSPLTVIVQTGHITVIQDLLNQHIHSMRGETERLTDSCQTTGVFLAFRIGSCTAPTKLSSASSRVMFRLFSACWVGSSSSCVVSPAW